MLDAECKRDIARRLYDELTAPDAYHNGLNAKECYLDGLWIGLTCCGMGWDDFKALEAEIDEMLDGLIEGEWE